MNLTKLALLAVLAGTTACEEPSAPYTAGDAATRVVSLFPHLPEPDAGTTTSSTTGAWQLHFSPRGGCEQMVVALIETAKKTIRVQAYGFTSIPIANALIVKKQMGVDVQGVFDRSDRTAKNSKTGMLAAAGIPVTYDAKHPIMHVKAMVIDGEWIELGSYNYTSQAENNAEDCLEEDSPDKAKLFTEQWLLHQAHSEP
jgi:phosphatidylserine/phosphatidylglycerophosphate/cardiolipin synthase-like enzyme